MLSAAPGAVFFHWVTGSLAEGIEMAERALPLPAIRSGPGSGLNNGH